MERFAQFLHRTTGDRVSSLDTDGVWLRLEESRVSWGTSFLLSSSPVLGGEETSGGAGGGEPTSFVLLSFPVGLF